MGDLNTTVKVAADWASDSASDWASDWASHSTVFNHSKVDYLNPLFEGIFYCKLAVISAIQRVYRMLCKK
jgi:hypothetical protein